MLPRCPGPRSPRSWAARARARARARAGLALVLLLLALAGGAAAWAAPPLRVDFIAVGQGDATLVVSPAGKTVLIDGGPREAAPAVLGQLRRRSVATIDLVLLTHRHADHLGGLPEVLRAVGARLFMDAPFPHPSPAYAALVTVLEQRRIIVRQAQAGRQIDLGGGARLVLLGPPEPPIGGTRSDVNANGVVARLEYGRVAVLFAADAEAATERWLLGQPVSSLRATALKVAHHGSRHSTGARFLAVVRPEVAIVSAGAGNPYGHPHAPTLDRLALAGARIYRTDVDGTITLETDGRTLRVHTATPPRRP